MLCDVPDVDVAIVSGVELVSNYRSVLKFAAGEDYQMFLRRFKGRIFNCRELLVRLLYPIRGALTYVSIHGAPIEFSEVLLQKYFRQFGTVVRVRLNVISSGHLTGVHNGIQMLEMGL